MKSVRGRIIIGFLITAALQGSDLQVLYDSHAWFRLRDALAGQPPDAFFQGAVAAAFHQRDLADRLLASVIQNGPPERAAQAHELLANVAMREGMNQSALAHLKAASVLRPDRADLLSGVRLFEVVASWPDQSVVAQGRGRVAARFSDGNIFVPVTVNGIAREWLFDTGLNWCVITDREARKMNMEIRETSERMRDTSGRAADMRLANARELTLGPLKLRNVTFIVIGDDQEPFKDRDPKQRGGIGLPVMLAAGGFSWDNRGYFEVGTTAGAGSSNLAFDGATPLILAEYDGHSLPMHLDTGADTTHFWPKFAEEFPAAKAQGRPGATTVAGVGNQVEVDSIQVKSLRLRVGGAAISIPDATLLLKQEGAWAKYFYGNLGIDLLWTPKRVTLDFRKMRLTVGE